MSWVGEQARHRLRQVVVEDVTVAPVAARYRPPSASVAAGSDAHVSADLHRDSVTTHRTTPRGSPAPARGPGRGRRVGPPVLTADHADRELPPVDPDGGVTTADHGGDAGPSAHAVLRLAMRIGDELLSAGMSAND